MRTFSVFLKCFLMLVFTVVNIYAKESYTPTSNGKASVADERLLKRQYLTDRKQSLSTNKWLYQDCDDPVVVPASIVVTNNSFSVSWNASSSTAWECYVQVEGANPSPVGSGGNTSQKTWSTTTLSGGAGPLLPNTAYEFYIRSNCSGVKGQWVGPIAFRTSCNSFTLPFTESFDSSSPSYMCWGMLDNNKDGNAQSGLNTWKLSTTTKYKGDTAMAFNGADKVNHDDYLISPLLQFVAGKTYRLSYYYRTSASKKTNFRVVSSSNGTLAANFTNELLVKTNQGSISWIKETIIISNINGPSNIAWHITNQGSAAELYIDEIEIEEVKGCSESFNHEVNLVTANSATISWTDNLNKSWEYIVQLGGGVNPGNTATGIVTSTKSNAITQDKNGVGLTPSTTYDVYVRANCSASSASIWMGPYRFTTLCGVYAVPFFEGFNNDSPSWACWTVLDLNRDGSTQWGDDIWLRDTSEKYEGTASAKFNRFEDAADNDYLISPPIQLQAGKTYRLKYQYKTTSSNVNKTTFEVVLSKDGIDVSDFTTTVVASRTYSNLDWKEERAFIQGSNSAINLAWKVSGTNDKEIYIDAVSIEEVLGCTEPMNLEASAITNNSAIIGWDAGSNLSWQYYVQDAGSGLPIGQGTNTSTSSNPIVSQQNGSALVANTIYEFYVRSACTGGGFSDWNGPYEFTTLCGVYTIPFKEGFNKNSSSMRCWSSIDNKGVAGGVGKNTDQARWKQISIKYEGDFALYPNGVYSSSNFDDWLITPDLDLKAGESYVLKYHFRTSTSTSQANSLAVLLSDQGIDKADFTTVISPKNTYVEGSFIEKEIIFTATKDGIHNIAWHYTTTTSTGTFYIDNVIITKLPACSGPYDIVESNITSSGIDLDWKQDDNITNWEVIVVEYGQDENATPVFKQSVTGAPKVSITGLDSAKGYTYYIRSICPDGLSKGDFSGARNFTTKIGSNDICSGKLTLPVNSTLECVQMTPITNIGATISEPNTAIGLECYPIVTFSDAWFEFTATSTVHPISIHDVVMFEGVGKTIISGVLFDDDCNAITAGTSAPLECFKLASSIGYKYNLRNLVPGKKYTVLLTFPKEKFMANVCITTPEVSPLEVNASGDKYTVEELIKDVFVNSECDLVSNVHYQNGSGSLASQQYNTFGYFNKGKSNFPFEEGIVLSTNEVEYVPGPFMVNNENRGNNNERWIGDKDINDAIQAAGGGPYPDKRVTQVEFDFVPVTDSIQFEYLFASESYSNLCTYKCDTAALFAAWLIDTKTGEGINLAKVLGTNEPISTASIRNADWADIPCTNENVEFLDVHYFYEGESTTSPIDFIARTKPMLSENYAVVPGRTYHIKLAVMDFCKSKHHSSAVFFNAGSFDLGKVNLGKDMLVEDNTAVCDQSSTLIKSGVNITPDFPVEITWTKDGQIIDGAELPDLLVTEAGTYKIEVTYPTVKCQSSSEVVIEFFPPIHSVVENPTGFDICNQALEIITLDLTEVETQMFGAQSTANYKINYYKTKDNAIDQVEEILELTAFPLGLKGYDTELFIRIEDLTTGCTEVFTIPVRSNSGAMPEAREEEFLCASYTFPPLASNQAYYLQADGKGERYLAGDVLMNSGSYDIYVLQINTDTQCYEQISYTIHITEGVEVDTFNPEPVQCKVFTLPALSPNNKYFTKAGGSGIELQPNDPIYSDQTIYVYASSSDGVCVEESSFNVKYEDCPIPKGISPNGDGLNDSFDLLFHNVADIKIYNRNGNVVYTHGYGYTNQWHGQSNNGKELPSATYYYVIITHGKVKTGWVELVR